MLYKRKFELERLIKDFDEDSIIKFDPGYDYSDTAFNCTLTTAVHVARVIRENKFYNSAKDVSFFIYEKEIDSPINVWGEWLINAENRYNVLLDIIYNFYVKQISSIKFYENNGNYLKCVNNEEPQKKFYLGLNRDFDHTKSMIFNINMHEIYSNKPQMLDEAYITEFCNFNREENPWVKLYEKIIDNVFLNKNLERELRTLFDEITDNSIKLLKKMLARYDENNEVFWINCELKNKSSELDTIIALPREAEICDYIESVYNLIKVIFRESFLFSQSQNEHDIIERILNFGIIDKNNIDENKTTWILSPFALNSLRNTYDWFEKFISDMANDFRDKNEWTKLMMEQNFVSLNFENFRRWIYLNNENSLVSFDGQENILCSYDCHKLSSISLVRSIRNLEKIKQSIIKNNNNIISKNKVIVNICIIGYTLLLDLYNKNGDTKINGNVYPIEVIELSNTLKKWASKNYKNVEFRFSLFINSEKNKYRSIKETEEDPKFIKFIYNKGKNGEIRVLQFSYDALFKKNNLKYIIDKYDTMFFVDCPDLYFDDFARNVSSSWQNIYLKLKNTTYNENYKENRIYDVYGSKGILSEIEEQLSVFTNIHASGAGSYNPSIKENLLDWIDEYLGEIEYDDKRLFKILFFPLSSVNSNKSSKYSMLNITHTEKYNYKQVYIITLEEKRFEKKYINQTNNMDNEYICLSLWNLFKNVAIKFKNIELNSNGKKYEPGEIPYLFDNIVIKLSWDKSMKNFSVSWGKNPEIKHAFKDCSCELNEYLKDLFEIVLGKERRLFYPSIRDAFCNILLGRAKTSGHMLLYHRVISGDLRDIKINVSSTISDSEVIALLQENYISPNSDKKLYYDIMTAYARYSISELQEYTYVFQCAQNERDFGKICDNILRTCEFYNYTDSDLYLNLKGGILNA